MTTSYPRSVRYPAGTWNRADRRPLALANQAVRPIPYDQLSAPNQARFDAQMKAWRAGQQLALAAQLAVEFGIPVPGALVDLWEEARDEHALLSGNWRSRYAR